MENHDKKKMVKNNVMTKYRPANNNYYYAFINSSNFLYFEA